MITIEQITAVEGKLGEIVSRSDFAWAIKVSGRVVAYFGVQRPTLMSAAGYLWMRTLCEAAPCHLVPMLRLSRSVISQLLQRYPILIGECELSDARAQRWLTWLGATFTSRGRTAGWEIHG